MINFFRKIQEKINGENHEFQSTQSNSAGHKSLDARENKEGKSLRQRVMNTAYIDNLRIGRSWVLPQMVDMCFNGSRFSKDKYMKAVASLDYDKAWVIALRNYRVISLCQDKADEFRSYWWTKEVAVAMAKNDLKILKNHVSIESRHPRLNCSGGPYIRMALRGCTDKHQQMYFTGSVEPSSKWYGKGKTMDDLYRTFEARINAIEQAQTPNQMYEALKEYDAHRCSAMQAAVLPQEFRNAFIGDGAFTSMMTIVKFLGLEYKDDAGNTLTNVQCVEDIENKAREFACDGEKMFDYLAEKFFDNGNGFDINSYRQGSY